ncbi:MAG: hypothetical protein V1783_07870 [Bacteroidota bacterium]
MKEKYIEDLKEIKDIMNRSTRFISLSGLSGVSTGITALIGVSLAYLLIFKQQNYLVYPAVDLNGKNLAYLLIIAIGTLMLSIGMAIFFTTSKTKKRGQNIWDSQTKRLLINLIIPLTTGGILSLMLIFKGYLGIVPPLTLIFYGLALVNGSKYTLPDIRNLGLIEIILGLIAFQLIQFSLLFWAIGFGLMQIIYGIIVQRKYKS